MNNDAGQLFDIWTKEELDEIVEVMKDIPSIDIYGNECKGIDENHVEYYWFMSVVYSKLSKLFDKDILPVFGMYLNETTPWGVHTDAYHCKKFNDREPALSILIPYSLDNDINNLDKGFTLVFNETLMSNDDIENLPDSYPNSLDLYDEYLSHNPIELMKKLSIKGVYPWKLGSVIYWNSCLLHDSNNFLRHGMTSKQALVVHTYRQKIKNND